jgi:hypothetical protein
MCRWENNFQIDVIEQEVPWIDLIEDRDRRRTLKNTAMKNRGIKMRLIS